MRITQDWYEDPDEAPPCWRQALKDGNDGCSYCTGEACGQCNYDACEHDVMDRHSGPFYHYAYLEKKDGR